MTPFHVSMLKKYQPNLTHILDFETIKVDKKIKYVEKPIQVLDRRERILRNKVIPLVKVHHDLEEATWKSEEVMKCLYLHLFE